MKLLFVCTGNTCRSPMAAALANHILPPGITAESAGVAAFDGDQASSQAVSVMHARGIDVSNHRARLLAQSLLDDADLIITMTSSHRDRVLLIDETLSEKPVNTEILSEEFFEGQEPWISKVLLFSELVNAADVSDITDPWGGAEEIYEECAAILEEGLQRIKHIFKT